MTAYAGLAAYGWFAYREWRSEEKLLNSVIHTITAGAAILFYIASAWLEMPLASASFAALTGVLFVLAYLNNPRRELIYIIAATAYPTLFHILSALNVPQEIYPPALAALSVVIFGLEQILTLPEATNIPRKHTALAGLALTCFFAFGIALEGNNATLHLAGWVSGYALLGLLWLGKDLFALRLWDYVIGILGLAQYYWHMIYLQQYVSPALFSEMQWYTAAAGTLALMLAIREAQRETDAVLVTGLEGFAAALFFLPTLAQILDSGNLFYFGAGIIYSLVFVALGVLFQRRLLQQIGAVGLIATVLVQTREFFFNLPRWLVVGVIGFGLIGAALYLSLRRRGEKKPA